MTRPIVVAAVASFVAAHTAVAQTGRSCDSPTIRSLGTSIAVLRSSDISTDASDLITPAPRSAHALSDLLTARIPGVSVMKSSGVAGTGSRVRLRGPSGLIVQQQPLLYINGMRVDGELQSIGLNAGGQAPSRIDDIPVDDIDCVAVLRGPAATARYGTDAAGGIIYVVTRRPRSDSSRVQAFVEGGATTDRADYPANYGTATPSGANGGCTRVRAAAGQCTPGAIISWSPMNAVSPFRTAPLVRAGARASLIKRPNLSLGVSGSGSVDDGALRINDHRRYNAGLTADWRPNGTITLDATTWFMGGTTNLPRVGNDQISILNSALLGSAVDDPVRRGYRNVPLSVLEEFGTDQRLRRFGGVARMQWTPSSWLSIRALGGAEDSRATDEQFDPGILFSQLPNVFPPEFLVRAERREKRTMANAFATATYGRQNVRLATEIGAEYVSHSDRQSTDAVDVVPPSSSEDHTLRLRHPKMSSIIGRQSATLFDRLFLEGGARHDLLNNDFGKLRNPTYPFFNAAWDVVRPAASAGISEFRVRGAFGESGDRRPYSAAIAGAAVDPRVQAFPVERTREVEGGFAIGLLGNRLAIDATYFSKRTSDALLNTISAPGVGGSFAVIVSGGEWTNRGFEIATRARIAEFTGVRADVEVIYTSLENEVTSLANTPPNIATHYEIRTGYPLYGMWAIPYAANDQNSDGVITAAEVSRTSPNRVYLGSSVPTRELGIAPSVTFGRSITLTGVIDYRGGFRVINHTGRLRCNANCAELYVPSASLVAQARAVDPTDALGGWIEDGSFVKLRELTLAWMVPQPWSKRISAKSAQLVVAGRNLWTSTDYTGFDPEVTLNGQQNIFQEDLFTLPLPRTVSLRLGVSW